MKKITTQIENFQYFYPYTVAIVGAQSGNQTNYMACAWHTALSFDPPLFGVLVAKKRLTHQVISEAREFTVNFISSERVKLSAQMGRKSGHDMDKIKEFQVKLSPQKLSKLLLSTKLMSLSNVKWQMSEPTETTIFSLVKS